MSLQIRLPSWARRFAGDTKGVSAVEFALVLPLMLTLYLGGVEVSQAIAASRKVTLVSRTVADLASQSSKITAAQMTNILNASAAVVSPFPSNKLKVTVAQIMIDADGNKTTDWQVSLNGGVSDPGAGAMVPDALIVPGTKTYLIWASAEYDYEPVIGYAITGNLTLKDRMYMRPRLSEDVDYPAPS
jgi:Flp pilus assembly protein TadG